ncbi:MAG: hypothetical protein KGZ52_09470 [Xanthomonadaceae bacterium]|nr:hypothetical protein [Xanthomonadaceae bacterium]
MVVAGRALDGIDSPGLLIAMLKHTAARCEAEGRAATLRMSPVLEQAAAAEGGHTLEDWLAMLEAERAEHAEKKRAVAEAAGPPPSRH